MFFTQWEWAWAGSGPIGGGVGDTTHAIGLED
jgi:hypothetical protein